MPCFLNVIVGSKSVPDASALSPGPESCTSIATWPSDAGYVVVTRTEPPGPAASAAFWRRLVRMPFTRSAPAWTRGVRSSSLRW